MAGALSWLSLLIASTVRVTQACDAIGLQKCFSDFSAALEAEINMSAKCAAVDTYETCFASKSARCSVQMTSALISQSKSAEAQLSCSSGDISANNPAGNAANGETTSSSDVTVTCDAVGLQQCVTAFGTELAVAIDMAAKCKALNTYGDCLTSKSAGCPATQRNAYKSVKTSLSCDESLVSKAPLMPPNGFAISIISSLLVVASVG